MIFGETVCNIAMAKQVFDSHDLSELIYSFSKQGFDEHQEKHADVCEEIVQDFSFEDLLPDYYEWYYESWMRHDETPHILECLRITYTQDQLRLFSLSMRWCRCCSRHSHYKTVPFKPVNPVPESKCVCHCSCPCRHLYRFFKTHELA